MFWDRTLTLTMLPSDKYTVLKINEIELFFLIPEKFLDAHK